METLDNYITEKLRIGKSIKCYDTAEMLDIAEALFKNINYKNLSYTSICIDNLANNFNVNGSPINEQYEAVSIFRYERYQGSPKDLINNFVDKYSITPDTIKEYGNIIIVDKDLNPVYYINIQVDFNKYPDIQKITQISNLYSKHSEQKIFVCLNLTDNNYKVYSATDINTSLN